MPRFTNKVALVTGSGSGIGKATVDQLIAEGAKVIGADLNPGEAAENYVPVVTDVTQEDQIQAAVQTAVDQFGTLDLAFNVAGASKSAPIEEMSEGDWDFTVDLVLKGIFLSVKHEARAMSGGGAIVNVASLNAHVPMWFGAAYVAGKAGAEGFTKNAALELGGKGIRVNAILPGLVTTPLTSDFSENEALTEAFEESIVLSRPATPEEIAKPMLFLASDDAAYITGTSLVVDGGWEITGYPDLSKYMG